MQEDLVVSVTTRISASMEEVWRTLTTFDQYSAWHPTLRIDGTPETAVVGARLDGRLTGGPSGQQPFSVTIVDVDAPRRLVWEGGTPSVLFGRHSFVLTALPDGTTECTDSEEFSGSSAAEVLGKNRHQIEQDYTRYDAALKAWVESRNG